MTLVVLDWRSASHHASRGERCVHCGERTRLRNDAHRPAHKRCQEIFDDQVLAGHVQPEQKASQR